MPSGAEELVAAYLDQNPDGDDRTAEATVMAARPDVAELDGRLRAVEQELARPDVIADLARIARVLERQQGFARSVGTRSAGPAWPGRSRRQLLSLEHPGGGPGAADEPAFSGGASSSRSPHASITQPDLLLLDDPETT